MSILSRLGWIAIAAGGLAPALHAAGAGDQFIRVMQDSPAYLGHASQGYLGVDIRDLDEDRMRSLKLKDVRGAEVVIVDHDAPAAKAGIRVHDVILQMNGQPVEGVEQLRRMLRETPAGRTVNFGLSRDGQPVNLTVQLADRAELERRAMDGRFIPPDPGLPPPALGESLLGGRTPGHLLGHWSLGGSSALSIGAVVDPVGDQLASYFGVKEGVGLLVKNVEKKSPAEAAGLKAGDVILKVNQETVATRADWERAIRENRGKQVQLTVIRDKKQQTLTMTAGGAKQKSELEWPSAAQMGEMVAEINEAIDPQALAEQARQQVEQARRQMETAREQMEQMMEPAPLQP